MSALRRGCTDACLTRFRSCCSRGSRWTAESSARRSAGIGNLRSALLAAAERTVRERGVQDLSLRELAREVGVSHGAPRRHFPDRQALLDALAESGFDRLGAELRAAADGAGDEFQARLAATAAAYIRFATTDPALLDLMFASKHRATEPSLHDAMERAFSVMMELILQGQAIGRLQPGDPERVGLVLLSTIQGSPEPFSGDGQRRKLELWPEWVPDPEMTPPTLTAIRSRLNNTYTGYSIGCAAVWAALLATGRGLLDAKNWDMLRLGAAGWWAGWLSATIARVGYPPPQKLTEAGQRRLEKVSLVLVLLGFVNFFRLLITGRRRAGGTADGSS